MFRLACPHQIWKSKKTNICIIKEQHDVQCRHHQNLKGSQKSPDIFPVYAFHFFPLWMGWDMVYCGYGVATAQCGPILTIFAATAILHTIQVLLLGNIQVIYID